MSKKPAPKGQKTDQDFVNALLRNGIPHFDGGGGVSSNTTNNAANTSGLNAIPQVGSSIPVVGQTIAPIANAVATPVLGAVNNLLFGSASQNQYQANLAPTQSTDYSGAIAAGANQALSGYGQAQNIQAQQQQLANQLQAQSMGQGPNPAQAALAQNTGNNISSQASLMAGQRGAGANVGLMARQNAMQGAATQQSSVGQAATLQANQQIAAQQALAQQQSNMAQQNISEQGVNANIFNAAAGAQNSQNNTSVQNYGMAQDINSKTAQANTDASNKSNTGIMGGIGSMLGSLSKGGDPADAPKVPVDHSGHVELLEKAAAEPKEKKHGPKSKIGQRLAGSQNLPPAAAQPMTMAKGGKVPALISPGEGYLTPDKVEAVKHGKANPVQVAAKVPGKAKVKGDSLKNDVVKANLDAGGIVIPRSVMNSKDPAGEAHKFVSAVIAKQNMKKR